MKFKVKILGMVLAGALCGSVAVAQDNSLGLPATLAWSAYDVGSGGYNQAVAIGNAFKQKYGVNLRILPGKNDVSRTLPLREGKVAFSAHGVGGSYMAQEGTHDFGQRQWGPQPVRSMLLNNSDQALSMVVAGDIGVKTLADLKGKRVAWVIGSPALNESVAANLAFANLTWDDVQKVEFGGFGAAMDGIINNQVDAAFSSSISGKTYAVAKSPRGMTYPEYDPNDKEAWKRMQALAPFFFPVMATDGADLSKDKPIASTAYPYPFLMTYADRKADLVKKVMYAMTDTYDAYKDAAPGNIGWALDRQKLDWAAIPYHEGAVQFFKEKGLWAAEHDANNARLLKRQEVLATAWKDVNSRKHDSDEAFKQDWMKTRADALVAASMDPIVLSW
ncbi:TAXI family TRAP transporter solute-binding subunit [Alcaligenaceae bacterium]|nr:TAXI family TRAP transporter solute-binding subunit [Alcaligenaceae bacterium]